MIKRTILCLLIAVFPAPRLLHAKAAGDLLLLDKGARACALAGALSAAGQETAFDFAANPAGLADRHSTVIGFDHNEWGQDMRGEYLSVAFPFGHGAIGSAVEYFSYGSIESVDATGAISGKKFAPYVVGLKTAYGTNIRQNLSLGVLADIYLENIDDYSDIGAGVSLGALWQSPWEGIRFGLNARNIGMTKSGYSLPGEAVIGCAWTDALIKKMTIFLETELGWADPDVKLNMAAEYAPSSWSVFRIGYRHAFSGQSWAGAGLSAGIGLQWMEWQLGYALFPQGELAVMTHRVSLEYAFLPPVKKTAVPDKPAPVVTPEHHDAFPGKLDKVIAKRLRLGKEHYQKGKYQAAVHEWKMVLDIDPRHTETLRLIRQAEQKWQALLEQYRKKARLAREQQNLVDEIVNWKQVLELYPEDKEAGQGLAKAQQLAPAMEQVHYNTGLDHYMKGRYKEAITCWEKVLVLNPQNYKAVENIQKTKEKLIHIE